MQDGALNGQVTAAFRDERDGAAERRRFVPSPPCLRSGDDAPPDTIPFSLLVEDEQRRLLPAVAAAIDAVHRYRVAHGALSGESILAAGNTIWIAGVGDHWGADDRSSPRDRDLAWFRNQCERFLGPSLQPGVGRTCRGMLAAWREPPPAPKSAVRNGRHSAKPIPLRKRRRVRIPWRWVGVVCLIIAAVSGVLAWNLTTLPMHTMRTLRVAFRKLPTSTQQWLDPSGRFDPIARQLRLLEGQDRWTRLENSLSALRPEAFIQVLSEPDDAYTDVLRKFLQANDPQFLGTMMFQYVSPQRTWWSRSLPRLKQLLDEAMDGPAHRTLQFCFLRAAGADEISRIKAILDEDLRADRQQMEKPHAFIIAEAFAALARLGHREPIARLRAAYDDASGGNPKRYLTTVLYYYPVDEARSFVAAFAASQVRPTLAERWQDVLDVVESAAPGDFRKRSSEVFERVLREWLPRTLEGVGPDANGDLLMTLLCLWRLQTVSPEELLEKLSEPSPRGARIRARLSAMLIGDAEHLPDRLSLPDGWEVPDEWYAATLADGGVYPARFVRAILDIEHDLQRNSPSSLQRCSRLLALVNVRDAKAREALAADLSARLNLYGESWRQNHQVALTSVVALLAAAQDPAADATLNAYFDGGPTGRDVAAWEGLLVGATLDPARNLTLLKKASMHPLPSIWLRARELSALAEGNLACFRYPERTPPEAPAALTAFVEQLETANTEADVKVVMSRQRAGPLAELALGLSGSPGAAALLHARMDRNESPFMTYLLLANQPRPFGKRFDEFLHATAEPRFQDFEPAVMIGHVLKNDLGDDEGSQKQLETLRVLAVGPRGGKGAPPVLHRLAAVYAYGALRSAKAEPEEVRDLLSVIDRDANLFVRHAAAQAALRAVQRAHKKLLTDFAAERPKLPPNVAAILKLAAKL